MNAKPFWTDWIALEDNKNNHYNVYVVELSKEIMQVGKFKKRNPHAKDNARCLYVGMTGLSPEIRFKKHKDGIKANVYVQRYGIKLLPNLYKDYLNLSFEDAKAKEAMLGEALKQQGFAVWWA